MLPLNLYARVRLSTNIHCTRDRGCSAHPVFPAPSRFQRVKIEANLGRIAPREYGRTSSRCLKFESENSPARRPGQVSASERRSGTHTALCPRYGAMDDAIFAKLAPVAMGPCVRRDDNILEARFSTSRTSAYSPHAANASLKARSPGAPFSIAMMARRWLT